MAKAGPRQDRPLLADLNISPLTLEALREQGWRIVRVSERLPKTAPDTEILDLARRERWTILTQDLDFSALIALRGWGAPSLITLRLTKTDPLTVSRRLLAVLPLLAAELEAGSAVTIEDAAVRVRKLPVRS